MVANDCMPRGVKVAPLSKQSIKQKALLVREKLFKLEPNQSIDLSRELEHKLHLLGVLFDVLEVEEMPDVEALTNPDAMTIILRADTYDALCNIADPKHRRARFTVAHEIGHLILHEGFALARGAIMHKHYEDSEWQADTFAAELLMPTASCIGLSIEEIQEQFQVGYKAAKNKFNSLK
ncbi:MAG: ImmA/IrrE family metallo-endopeptidase [Acinetobacter populi]|jgi:Zn-dependent peptidase ImmA (M78 family)|uniref:ImmA/IrrE family metallo-endopeptidase n=1 Tax=Acinetobacter populi TaxID=1582270 RepID=UPI0023535380|nr:ImmA/IrrE family metallo-endopeptidase [Acinetobacter populi]MCH4247574.1 ImmA/IrrE family metallo-endopeptidase [Acinetobacter populi]